MDQIFYRKNRAGLIEAIDMTTNKIVAVQHSMETFNEKSTKLSEIIIPDGRHVWIEASLVVKGHALNAFLPERSYSKLHADLLTQLIVEGFTLKKACEELSLEYWIVNRWQTEHTDFRDRLNQARKDRAEAQHDKILALAEESKDPKIEIDALKYSAGVNDPDKFGNKTKISGDKNNPLSFVLSTGIDRTPEPPAEEKDVLPIGAANPALETQAVEPQVPTEMYPELAQTDLLGNKIYGTEAT